MGKWTISITVHNALDRPLKLDKMDVPWGIEESRADFIAPGQAGKYTIYSPSGASWGPEYSLTLSDVPPEGAVSYGKVDIHVDVPFSSKNMLEVKKHGELHASGYAEMSAKAHDYITDMMISR